MTKPTSEHRKAEYKSYKLRGQRAKNKIVKITRHLVKQPKDEIAREALKRISP